MPWSGSSPNKSFTRTTGTFTGSTAWAQEDAAGTKVVSTKFDTHDQDIATGINTCLTKDGGNSPTVDINWGGHKITNLAAPTNGADAVTKTYADAVLPVDADYGDITVSASGATWTIDNDAITTAKILDSNVTYAKIATAAIATAANIRASASSVIVTPNGIESAAAAVALTDVATIAVDWDSGINFTVTLGGNRAIGFPTNMQAGTWRRLQVSQDGTGSRTLDFTASGYYAANGDGPLLSTGANDVDVFYLFARSSSIVEVYSGSFNLGQIA